MCLVESTEPTILVFLCHCSCVVSSSFDSCEHQEVELHIPKQWLHTVINDVAAIPLLIHIQDIQHDPNKQIVTSTEYPISELTFVQFQQPKPAPKPAAAAAPAASNNDAAAANAAGSAVAANVGSGPPAAGAQAADGVEAEHSEKAVEDGADNAAADGDDAPAVQNESASKVKPITLPSHALPPDAITSRVRFESQAVLTENKVLEIKVITVVLFSTYFYVLANTSCDRLLVLTWLLPLRVCAVVSRAGNIRYGQLGRQ